jgi:hypothetical protein
MKWTVSLLALFICFLACACARAEEPASVRVGASAQLWGLTEGACRQDGDVFECTTPTLFGDVALDGRWRPLPLFSVGLNLGYGFGGGTPEVVNSNGSGTRVETRIWRVTAEPRLHLAAATWVDFHAGLELGVVSVRETLVAFEGSRENEVSTGAQPGGVAGVSFGVGFGIWEGLELELGGRAAWVGLGSDDLPELAPNRFVTDYGSQVWIGGYALVGWRFDLEGRAPDPAAP